MPEIGDVKIKYSFAPDQNISIVSTQTGNTFAPYIAKNGSSIELLETGVHTAAGMFSSAQSSNRTLTWILRLVGFLVMGLGFSMILGPLVVIGDVVYTVRGGK